MAWLDNIIVAAIIVVGLFLFYKALKEPLDLLFGMIRNGIMSLKDKVSESKAGDMVETIQYG